MFFRKQFFQNFKNISTHKKFVKVFLNFFEKKIPPKTFFFKKKENVFFFKKIKFLCIRVNNFFSTKKTIFVKNKVSAKLPIFKNGVFFGFVLQIRSVSRLFFPHRMKKTIANSWKILQEKNFFKKKRKD